MGIELVQRTVVGQRPRRLCGNESHCQGMSLLPSCRIRISMLGILIIVLDHYSQPISHFPHSPHPSVFLTPDIDVMGPFMRSVISSHRYWCP